MLNMLNIGGDDIYAYLHIYANMHPLLYICIFDYICKYAKYAKYRGGRYIWISPEICKYGKYAKYRVGVDIYAYHLRYANMLNILNIGRGDS